MNFNDLNLPIPDNVYKKSLETQEKIYSYLSNMKELEKTAYLIAHEHLGSSFNILKSNGYKEWSQKMETKTETD
jgi:competence protein ComGC